MCDEIEESQALFTSIECKKILNNYTQEPFILIDYEVAKFSESILGFLSEHLSLIINYKSMKSDQLKKATFFVKTMPQSNDSQNEYIREMNVFAKEARIFKNLFSAFSSLTSKPFAPKCYLTQEDKFIVLEDLRVKGYNLSSSSFLSYEKMVSLLKTMASFHAASIIFEEKRSSPKSSYRLNEHFENELRETTFSFIKGHPRNDWCINVGKCLNNFIDVQTKYTSDDKKQLQSKLGGVLFHKMAEFIQPSQKFRNVINHDDLWCNNILFKEDKKCIIVDFQLARYVPAAYDLLMALHLNTNIAFLRNNVTIFLTIYYDALTKELNKHGIDIDNIYTKKQFRNTIDMYRLPALMECVMYGTIIYLPQELSRKIISDVTVFDDFMFKDRSKYVLEEYLNNSTFKNRFDQVLLPLLECLEEYNEI